ncbi:MAG TPA: hypothetical protein VK465_07850 [Fibrobacteria bacterium]|nr:hypothetical protein [Fibrobacteria bacterium]
MKKPTSNFLSMLTLTAGMAVSVQGAECASWQTRHPDWIFCDDFESTAPLVGAGRYFEHDNNKGDFVVMEKAGQGGSRGMRALWQTSEVEAGNIKLGFGRNPSPYMSKGIRPAEDFREVYYRVWVKAQEGFIGDPYKLSRATVIAKSDWSQAMIAHIWGDRAEHLQVDPASCVDASGNVICSGYNDFGHLKWIGAKAGVTKPFTGANAGKWMCIEAHVKLNDAGQSNGIQEFWIDDKLEARREGLNFVGSYKAYGINGIYLENHWNSGSPKVQERSLDNFVVSTKRIGCEDGGQTTTPVEPPPPPTPPAPSRNWKSLPPSGSLIRQPGVIPWISAFGGARSVTGRLVIPASGGTPAPGGTPTSSGAAPAAAAAPETALEASSEAPIP